MSTEVQQRAAATAMQSVLRDEELRKLGLREEDRADIHKVADAIDSADPDTIAAFGHEIASHTSQYTDALLNQVHNRDLSDAGAKLSKVVALARGINIDALADKRSRLPVIGPLVDRFRKQAVKFAGTFETTRDQIETLLDSVHTTQTNLAQRNAGMESMYDSVREEYRLLGIHVAAGRIKVREFEAKAAGLREQAAHDPLRAQELADLEAETTSLDKRVGDLLVLQQSALQSLPMIRMIQANNQMLRDKFSTIREITLPAWKRQYMLALSLNEQRNSVQLANAIDNTTNDLLKSNADLLYHNSVDAAKANQRLVIDISTLKSVQDTLVKSVEEVIRIRDEGIRQREQVAGQVEAMRVDLQKRLTAQRAADGQPLQATTVEARVVPRVALPEPALDALRVAAVARVAEVQSVEAPDTGRATNDAVARS